MSSDDDGPDGGVRRRSFLGGLAGLGALSLAAGERSAVGIEAADGHAGETSAGPPRFTNAGGGMAALDDPLGTDADHPAAAKYNWSDDTGTESYPRDGLAPWNPDPDADYEWSVVDSPSGSSDPLGVYEDAVAEPDGSVVSFEAEVPGTYRLELTERAPDGETSTYEKTIRVFPEPSVDPNYPQEQTRPRIRLDGEYDADAGAVVVDADVAANPDNLVAASQLDVEFLVDDRSSIDGVEDDWIVREPRDGGRYEVARRLEIPESELDADDEQLSVYGVAYEHPDHTASDDGEPYHAPSVADQVRVDYESGSATVSRANEPPEWLSNATIYEIFTRRFAGGPEDQTTFGKLEERVQHLSELGVDALWMTPIHPAFATDERSDGFVHGYNITDHGTVDPGLGTMAEFESFVETCHENDIRVVFDLVLNHTADGEHPNHDEADDWYRWQAQNEVDDYYGWGDLANLNYNNTAVRRWALDVVDQWAGIVDGFRCDVAWGIQHSMWKELSERVRREHSTYDGERMLMLDESLPPDPRYDEAQFNLDYGRDASYAFRNQMVSGDAPWWGDGGTIADLATIDENRNGNGFPEHARFLQFIENHDESRTIVDVMETRGVDYETAKSIQKAGGAATFTLPGVPLLYYGQESGMRTPPGELDYISHYIENARGYMNWPDRTNPEEGEWDQELVDFYASLIETRDLPALAADAAIDPVEHESDDDRAFAFVRSIDPSDDDPDPGQRVYVFLNFAPEPATVSVEGDLSAAEYVGEAGTSVDATDAGIEATVESVAVVDAVETIDPADARDPTEEQPDDGRDDSDGGQSGDSDGLQDGDADGGSGSNGSGADGTDEGDGANSSETDDSSSDDGLPGFGVGTGLLGAVGGAGLAAKRLVEDDEE